MMANGNSLEAECQTFARYLLGSVPQPYVVGKYADAHRVSAVFSQGTRFDNLLVRVARKHPVLTRLADSHARMFAPTGLLRKKLVLLLAILETSAPSCHLIDAVDSGGKLAFFTRLAVKGTAFAISVAAGTIILLPVQMVMALEQRRDG